MPNESGLSKLTLSAPINFINPGEVLSANVSLDRHYIALQRSANHVDVIDLSTAQYNF